MSLLRKLFFVVFVLLANVFLIGAAGFFMHTVQLHQRFENEPIAKAQVLPYSQHYTLANSKNRNWYRTDLQFQTQAGQTIYLYDTRVSAAEKIILERGGAISCDYLLQDPTIIRPIGSMKSNLFMAILCGGIVVFNFGYLVYWWREY